MNRFLKSTLRVMWCLVWLIVVAQTSWAQSLEVPTIRTVERTDTLEVTVTFRERSLANEYIVERAQGTSLVFEEIARITSSPYIDTDLVEDIYSYRVSAVYNEGTSTPSLMASTLTSPYLLSESSLNEGCSGGAGRIMVWGDFDRDGDLDLVQHTDFDDTEHFGPQRHNKGGILTCESGGVKFFDKYIWQLTWDRSTWNVTGASLGDFDNDGCLDVYYPVSNTDGGLQYLGCASSFIDHELIVFGMWATDGTWVDYNQDGLLDLFINTNHSDNGVFDFNLVFRNDDGVNFTRLPDPGLFSERGSRHSAWIDFNNDGAIDYFSTLGSYQGNGDGTFIQRDDLVTNLGVLTDGIWEDKSTWADYDNDGDFDLFTPSAVYANNGDGTLTKLDQSLVINNPDAVSLTEAAGAWLDIDNDGFLDYLSTPNFYLNSGNGDFYEMNVTSIVSFTNHWGLGTLAFQGAWADYTNNGFLDLAFGWSDNGGSIFTHLGNNNHWLNVWLEGTQSNRAALGAVVRVKSTSGWQTRYISGGETPKSQHSLNAEFGLGMNTTIDSLVINWPSGTVQAYDDVQSDQFLRINESEPYLASQDLAFGRAPGGATRVSWTPGNGTRRLVIAREGAAVNVTPQARTNYDADANFGSGLDLGEGNFVVYDGAENSFVLEGLEDSKVYYLEVFDYNIYQDEKHYLTLKSLRGEVLEVVTTLEDPQVSALAVYPVPARNELKIQWTTSQNVQQFNVLGVSGQILQEIPVIRGQLETTLDVSGYAAGLYYLQMISQSGTWERKIIISKR